MNNEKYICGLLKEIRKRIAEANDIMLESPNCDVLYCTGTCPVCDSESEYIAVQLENRIREGKVVYIEHLCDDLLPKTVRIESNQISIIKKMVLAYNCQQDY